MSSLYRIPISVAVILFLLPAAPSRAAFAEDCPKQDSKARKASEQQCLADGGEWGKFGMHAHFCGLYTCATRTRDGGKECRTVSDCEGSCLYHGKGLAGTKAVGRCSLVNKRGFE